MTKTITFRVEVAGELRPVRLAFATEPDVRRTRQWRSAVPNDDAGEFAALAAKRWLYYQRQRAAVTSIAQIRTRLRADERAELAFLLVAQDVWTRSKAPLALALCRRTWCHHLALDFLAVKPPVPALATPIRRLGSGMIYGLVSLAEALNIELIWGEATASSAPFYERVLGCGAIEDLFTIGRREMQSIRDYYFGSQKESS